MRGWSYCWSMTWPQGATPKAIHWLELKVSGGLSIQDVLFGNSIGNELIGRGGNDVLVSGGTDNNDSYHDWLEGGPGADILIGGDGNDYAAYSTSEAGVEVRLYDGTAKGGDAEGDTFEDIEHLSGSKNDDVLAGDHGDNRIFGLWRQRHHCKAEKRMTFYSVIRLSPVLQEA